MKGMMIFGKRGNLSPRYIGPFEIIERVGLVEYDCVYILIYRFFIRYFMCPCLRGIMVIGII